MRKLFTGILLAAALPASASITSDINAGEISVADIINTALAGCGGSASCQELAIAEAVTAGIDITTAINLAVASGVNAQAAVAAASEAGIKSGQSVDAVLASALAANDVSAVDAVSGVTQGAESSGSSKTEAQNLVTQAATKQNVDPQIIASGVTNTPLNPTAGGDTKQDPKPVVEVKQPVLTPISPAG